MKKVELSGWDPLEPTCGFGTPSEYARLKEIVINGLNPSEYNRLRKLRNSIDVDIWISVEGGYIVDLGLGSDIDDPISSIPPVVWEFERLKELSLDRNEIKDVPDAIEKLKVLETLSLMDNKLTIFPESISKVTSLKSLVLAGNDIT